MKLYYAKSFDTQKGKYLYDSLANLLHEVDDKFYSIINSENMKPSDKNYYECYIKENNIRNVLNSAEISIAHNYTTERMKNIAESNRAFLVLSVTNKCNLNCTYCCYHDKFLENSNTNHNMSFETAKKAIDAMLKKSINQKSFHIGFYGGECLLEFDFIEKCVEYTKTKSIGVTVTFGVTTNGLFLGTEKIRRYFEKYDFQVYVSLDGPKLINDRYRTTENGHGSYDKVIENLKLWYNENPDYILEKVSITGVGAPSFHFQALDDYFSNFPLIYKIGLVEPTPFFEANIDCGTNCYADKLLKRENFKYSDKHYSEMVLGYKNYRVAKSASTIPRQIIPGGSCIPVFLRLYVNTKGDYYPCEKVPETEEFRIGNVETDIDYEKVVALFDRLISVAAKKCDNCWALILCGRCFKNINDSCEELLKTIEKNYIDYIETIKDDKKAIEILDSVNYSG